MQCVYHNDQLQTLANSPKALQQEKGSILPIKSDGSDSYPFRMKKERLYFGRGGRSDIRMHVNGVAEEHCVIAIGPDGRAHLKSLDKSQHTLLNGAVLQKTATLNHNDVITIVNRSFRFQYPFHSKFSKLHPPEQKVPENVKKEIAANDPGNENKSTILANSERNSVTSQTLNCVNKKVEYSLRSKRKSSEFLTEFDLRKKLKKMPTKRRVTFGPRLSPEEFDRNLPPASPLRRGSLPGRIRPDFDCTDSSSNVMRQKLAMQFLRSNSNKPLISPSTTQKDSFLVPTPLSNVEKSKWKGSWFARKLLFSEVVKKHQPELQPKNVITEKVKQNKNAAKLKKRECVSSERKCHTRLQNLKFGVNSTGHANSPATIFIQKKKAQISDDKDTLKKDQDILESKPVIVTENQCIPESNETCSTKSSDCLTMELKEQYSGSKKHLKQIKPNIITQELFTADEEKVFQSLMHKRSPVITEKTVSPSTAKGKHTSNKDYFSPNSNYCSDTIKQLDQEKADKTINFRESIKSLIFESDLLSDSSCEESMSHAPDCMSTIKQVVLTMSMVKAFHEYKRIIDDIAHSPHTSSATPLEVLQKKNKDFNTSSLITQEELELQDFLKKHRKWVPLIQKYRPELLGNDVYEMLNDDQVDNACASLSKCSSSSQYKSLLSESFSPDFMKKELASFFSKEHFLNRKLNFNETDLRTWDSEGCLTNTKLGNNPLDIFTEVCEVKSSFCSGNETLGNIIKNVNIKLSPDDRLTSQSPQNHNYGKQDLVSFLDNSHSSTITETSFSPVLKRESNVSVSEGNDSLRTTKLKGKHLHKTSKHKKCGIKNRSTDEVSELKKAPLLDCHALLRETSKIGSQNCNSNQIPTIQNTSSEDIRSIKKENKTGMDKTEHDKSNQECKLSPHKRESDLLWRRQSLQRKYSLRAKDFQLRKRDSIITKRKEIFQKKRKYKRNSIAKKLCLQKKSPSTKVKNENDVNNTQEILHKRRRAKKDPEIVKESSLQSNTSTTDIKNEINFKNIKDSKVRRKRRTVRKNSGTVKETSLQSQKSSTEVKNEDSLKTCDDSKVRRKRRTVRKNSGTVKETSLQSQKSSTEVKNEDSLKTCDDGFLHKKRSVKRNAGTFNETSLRSNSTSSAIKNKKNCKSIKGDESFQKVIAIKREVVSFKEISLQNKTPSAEVKCPHIFKNSEVDDASEKMKDIIPNASKKRNLRKRSNSAKHVEKEKRVCKSKEKSEDKAKKPVNKKKGCKKSSPVKGMSTEENVSQKQVSPEKKASPVGRVTRSMKKNIIQKVS